jgi:hypothetical protein
MVTDLTTEPRFKQLGFVTGPPYLRFYAGTPIITDKGIPIGSLFVVDEKVRAGLGDDEIEFLGTMSKTIMKHLEMNREAAQRKRALKMSEGLSRFVEEMTDSNRNKGKRQVKSFRSSIHKDDSLRQSLSTRSKQPGHSIENTPPGSQSEQRASCSSSMTSYESTDSEPPEVEPEELANTELSNDIYKRATEILRESLDLEGVLLYDGAVGFLTSHRKASISENDPSSLTKAARTFTSTYYDGFSKEEEIVPGMATILGHSTADQEAAGDSFELETQPYASIEESALQYFFHQFPRGKLWSLDDKGLISSSDEEPSKRRRKFRNPRNGSSSSRREAFEFAVLRRLFPGARQILFAALRDASSHRPLGGCFAWTANETLILSKEVELSYLTAFLNNVSAEMGQLQTVFADNQKTKFISSISHELRSPL